MAGARLLVTGASGFVGGWTVEHWRSVHPQVELWAASDRPCPAGFPAERYCQLDLREPGVVRDFLRLSRPAQVIHLAGLIGPQALADHLSVNVVGTECLYRALAEAAPEAKVVQAGSAAVYGVVRPEDLPIRESLPLWPVSPYAVSKAAQEHVAVAMGRTHGLRIIRARIFNMLGPRQPAGLVPMTFITQLADVRAGKASRLEVGNTEARRDFLDVRDVVRAFDLLLEMGGAGEAYNVGSGTDVSIRQIIEELLRITGVEVPIKAAAERLRAADVPCIRADVSKIASETGWRVRISLRESLEQMCGEGPL